MVDLAALEKRCGVYALPRVRIPPSPPIRKRILWLVSCEGLQPILGTELSFLSSKINFANIFQVLWQFFNLRGSLLRADGRRVSGIIHALQISNKTNSDFFVNKPHSLNLYILSENIIF